MNTPNIADAQKNLEFLETHNFSIDYGRTVGIVTFSGISKLNAHIQEEIKAWNDADGQTTPFGRSVVVHFNQTLTLMESIIAFAKSTDFITFETSTTNRKSIFSQFKNALANLSKPVNYIFDIGQHNQQVNARYLARVPYSKSELFKILWQMEESHPFSFVHGINARFNNSFPDVPYNDPAFAMVLEGYVWASAYFQEIENNPSWKDRLKNQYSSLITGLRRTSTSAEEEAFRFQDAQERILLNSLIEFAAEHQRTIEAHNERLGETLTDQKVELDSRTRLFEESFADFKTKYENHLNKAYSDQETLRQTYEKLLQLKQPADYWQKRADEFKDTSYLWTFLMVISVVLISAAGIKFIYNPPASFASSDLQLVSKVTLLSFTIISILAFWLRLCSKMMMSAFHLRRDAQERYSLTYYYLSLLKEDGISGNERNIVLQSLFARSDSGLLKGDGSPTFPLADVFKSATQQSGK